ncbi:CAP domain-containing protein [Ectothiorhodospiraceae bacterium BW-2]|nr:CAP domain-containing protein [Ectothiorhodospiraceae bacterium BW-2]
MKGLQTIKRRLGTPNIVPLLLLYGATVTVVSAAVALEEGFLYLNQLRGEAGVLPLTANAELAQAATLHARYLQFNQHQGHRQQPGLPYFTGETVIDRVIASEYGQRQVLENISTHSSAVTVIESIDSLMGAIYHRFAFLAFDIDEVGIGYSGREENHIFVYNLGNRELRQLCQKGRSYSGSGAYYQQLCADSRQRLAAAAVDRSRQQRLAAQPPWIVWPPPESRDTLPAFYDEAPDPLPDYSVSGYPISLQFNPERYRGLSPIVSRFELFALNEGREVTPTRLLWHANDPNHQLTPLQFALFPLQRLQWGGEYRVELDYLLDGKFNSLEWQFQVRQLPWPLYVIEQPEGIYINARSGEPFAVYLPPLTATDSNSDVRWRYTPTLTELKIEAIDGNTLKVVGYGRGRAEITFHQTRFEVVL